MAKRRSSVRRRRGPARARVDGAVERAARVARERFGIGRLHPLQRVAIEALLEGRDVLAVLPTGFGKSLLYQVPALLARQPTLVVSPLLALMADQEAALARRGVPVVRLDGTVRGAARGKALERLALGGALVVLTTPETLESDEVGPALAAARPWLLCVDEAHCISEWGHDFRPAYLRLGEARDGLGDPQVLALTATATPRVRDDVAERLRLRDPAWVVAPPHRENLALGVELVTAASKPERAGRWLRRLPRPGIVYCATTVEVERLAGALTRGRVPAVRYHGRLPRAEREQAQRRFLRPTRRGERGLVMVATSAFGMGIDKPDVRWVLHYQTPGSLEQYVQEAGRAGRDGLPARCVLLFDPADLAIQRHLQKQGSASPEQLRLLARALGAWAGEGRAATADELALSAGIPRTSARVLCTQLLELGALRAEERRYAPAVGRRELSERALELARRLETRRREDGERLAALEAYARSQECRSVVVRRYFGEEDAPRCGRCDRCHAEGAAVPGASPRRRRRRAGPGERERAARKGRARRRRRP